VQGQLQAAQHCMERHKPSVAVVPLTTYLVCHMSDQAAQVDRVANLATLTQAYHGRHVVRRHIYFTQNRPETPRHCTAVSLTLTFLLPCMWESAAKFARWCRTAEVQCTSATTADGGPGLARCTVAATSKMLGAVVCGLDSRIMLCSK
jgi:hypothetical protein